MPRAVLRAVVIVCLAQGFALGRGALGLAYVSAAVLFWVGFETLLRPGEMLNLRRRDVILPHNVGTSRDRQAVIIGTPRISGIWPCAIPNVLGSK